MDAVDDSKGKGFKERSIAVGKQAALQKQLQELKRSHQEVSKLHDAKQQKCDELRSKLTAAKASLGVRERELEVAQRLLQKAVAEKTSLKDEFTENQTYIRRLEAKLEQLQGSADIASKYQAAKDKVHEQQQQLAAAAADLQASHELVEQQQQELDRAKRALDIKVQELGRDLGGDNDLPAQLLHSLAESREEALLLAKHLAASKADLQKAKAANSKLSSRLDAEQAMRADAEAAAEALKERLEKLLDSSREVHHHRSEVAERLSAAQTAFEALQEEKNQLAEMVLEMQEELEQLKSASAHAKSTMQQAVHEATSKAEAELRDAKAAAAAAAELHHQRAAQLNQRCNQLAEQASQLDAALQKQVSSSQQTSAARQQQIQDLESQLQAKRRKELKLEQQVTELSAQVSELSRSTESVEVYTKQTDRLQKQVARLEAALRIAAVENQHLQQKMQQRVDESTCEQEEAGREADSLRVQLSAKDVLHRCALQEVSQLQSQLQELELRCQTLTGELQAAQAAKALVQTTLGQQVVDLKLQLQQALRRQSQQQQLHEGCCSSSHDGSAGDLGSTACTPVLPNTKKPKSSTGACAESLRTGSAHVTAVTAGRAQLHSGHASNSSTGCPVETLEEAAGVEGPKVKGITTPRLYQTGGAGKAGVLSAVGYVDDAAAAALDAARRGKTVAAARKLRVRDGRSSGDSCPARVLCAYGSAGDASFMGETPQGLHSGHKSSGRMRSSFASSADMCPEDEHGLRFKHVSLPVRTSLDLERLSRNQQLRMQTASSVLAQQHSAESQWAVRRTSPRTRHARSHSCDLTAAAAALDAEVTAVLGVSSKLDGPSHSTSQLAADQQPSLVCAPRPRSTTGQACIQPPLKSSSSRHISRPGSPEPAASGVPDDSWQPSVQQATEPTGTHNCTQVEVTHSRSHRKLSMRVDNAPAPGCSDHLPQAVRPSQSTGNLVAGLQPRSSSPAAEELRDSSGCRTAGVTLTQVCSVYTNAVWVEDTPSTWVEDQGLTEHVEPCSPAAAARGGKPNIGTAAQMTDPYSLPVSAEPSAEAVVAEQQQKQQQQGHRTGVSVGQRQFAMSTKLQQQQQHNQRQQQQQHRADAVPASACKQSGGDSPKDLHGHSSIKQEPSVASEVPHFDTDCSSNDSTSSSNQQEDERQHPQPIQTSGSAAVRLDAAAAAAMTASTQLSQSSQGVSKGAGNTSCISELLQVLPGPRCSKSRSSSDNSSSSSSSRTSRAQPPVAPRPQGAGLRPSRHQVPRATAAAAAAVPGGGDDSCSAVPGGWDDSCTAVPVGWDDSCTAVPGGGDDSCSAVPGGRHDSCAAESDRAEQHCIAMSFQSPASSQQPSPVHHHRCVPTTSGDSREQLMVTQLHGHKAASGVAQAASHNPSNLFSPSDEGSCVVAAGPTPQAGSNSVLDAATAVGVSVDSSKSAVGGGRLGVQRLPAVPVQQAAIQLLSPPSTCRVSRTRPAADGTDMGGVRGQLQMSTLEAAAPLSEEMLADVNDAPEDSWLVSCTPPQQEQHEQAQQQQQQRNPRRSSCGRLSGTPSLTTWQSMIPPAPAAVSSHRGSTNASRSSSSSSVSADATNPSLLPSDRSSSSKTGQQRSMGMTAAEGSNKMHALLADFEQGLTPSLQDLAAM